MYLISKSNFGLTRVSRLFWYCFKAARCELLSVAFFVALRFTVDICFKHARPFFIYIYCLNLQRFSLKVVFAVFRYPHLPCLLTGKKKDYYLPLEVCTVVPSERRHLSEQQIERLIRSASRPAPERQKDTQFWVGFLA